MRPNEPRPRVAMLLSNPYGPDVRAQKEAHMLALAGYAVTVIAWDRPLSHPPEAVEEMPVEIAVALDRWSGRCVDRPEPVKIIRVRLRAGWRAGARHLIPRIPLFWWRLLSQARRVRPAVVHAHQLDTLPVAYLVGRMLSVPVVYDAREYYAGMLEPTVGPLIAGMLERVDRYLTPRVGAVLAVGERQAERHRAMGGRVWVVHNSQPALLSNDAAGEARAFRAAHGIPEGALLVAYVGNLSADRLLAPVLEAMRHLDDVYLVIGGDGPQMDAMRAAASTCSRIRVLGVVPLARVACVVAASDVVYYGLEASVPNSFYFMPNLAFFAFAAGRPLLVTPVGEVAEVVAREKCGVVMEAATAAAAEDALRRLQSLSFRADLAARSQQLGARELNLEFAATQLLDAYSNVLKPAFGSTR